MFHLWLSLVHIGAYICVCGCVLWCLGLVEGKLDQAKGSFEITYAMGRDIGPNDVDTMLEKLGAWYTAGGHTEQSPARRDVHHMQTNEHCWLRVVFSVVFLCVLCRVDSSQQLLDTFDRKITHVREQSERTRKEERDMEDTKKSIIEAIKAQKDSGDGMESGRGSKRRGQPV
jgi:hypothetical protein